MSENDVNDKNAVNAKLDVLVTRMKRRLAELMERRQGLLRELVPMDAAIHELEQMLAAAGVDVKTEAMELPRAMETAKDIVEFKPVPRTVERSPARMERTGPGGDAPVAEVVTKDSTRFVASPKSGTPVPTNVEALRKALGIRAGLR